MSIKIIHRFPNYLADIFINNSAEDFVYHIIVPFPYFILCLEVHTSKDEIMVMIYKYIKKIQISLLILSTIRYLGRGWTFDDLEEATDIGQECHRLFSCICKIWQRSFLCKVYKIFHNKGRSKIIQRHTTQQVCIALLIQWIYAILFLEIVVIN